MRHNKQQGTVQKQPGAHQQKISPQGTQICLLAQTVFEQAVLWHIQIDA